MKTRILAVILLTAAAPACLRNGKPVGRVRVTPETTTLGYGESVPLSFAWSPAIPLERVHGRPMVFVHLLERPGRVLRTFDHPLPQPWKPGTEQRYAIDLYQSAVGPALPPGEYPLTIGLYDEWGYRWTLDTRGSDVGKREYRAGSVVVPPPDASRPRAVFSGEWGEAAPSENDEQILARRWLRGKGAIRIESERPVEARLLVAVSAAEKDGVRFSTDCNPARSEKLPPGERRLSIPGAGSRPCEIAFEPSAPAAPPGALCLEVLSWRRVP